MAANETPASNGNGRKPHSRKASGGKRAANGRFVKGHSGNPAGRVKGLGAIFRDKVREDPSELAGTLLEIASDDAAKPADRITAIREFLDRGWGKSPAHVPIEGANPLGLTEVEHAVSGLMDELAARREAATAGTPADGTLAATSPD